MKNVVQYRVIDQVSGRALGPWGSFLAAQQLQAQLVSQQPWRALAIVDDAPCSLEALITALGY